MIPRNFLLLVLLVALGISSAFGATAIKNLASIEGVRDNQLIGYGLVVGLNGTGDKLTTVFSQQSLTDLLNRMGVNVPPASVIVRNIASVIVTADMPPFAQPGERLDVTVAAVGDATNLQGGQLVLTPLKGADGRTYAVAQGPVVTGGFVAGRGANSETVNHPTAGRIPNGGIVEQAPPSIEPGARVRLQLRIPDFTTAARMTAALNQKFADIGAPVAHSDNAGLITVNTPAKWRDRTVEFISAIEETPVEPSRTAKVVMNERTGTVVLGGDVRIAPVSIIHGALSIDIETTYNVSQPEGFSQGQTTVTPQVNVGAQAAPARNVAIKPGATVEQLVRSLLSIGTTPRDVIAILQSVKAAGALEADLEVI
jgi:flagellar P-ring protein precursor FlgI